MDWGWSKGKGFQDWQGQRLVEMVHELQPANLLNDRVGVDPDFYTPEQPQPAQWVQVDGRRVTCEACHTLNGSWGCDRDNLDWKSPELLVRMLIDTVSKGGNLLLLVGKSGRKGKHIHPRMNGKFPFVYLFIRMAPRHHAQLGGCIQQPGNSPLHEVNVPA